jgi:hypothetical protein
MLKSLDIITWKDKMQSMTINFPNILIFMKKKGYSLLLSVILICQIGFQPRAEALTYNETALFAAIRFAPIGKSWSGNQLIDAPEYNFDSKSKVSWGRGIFRMPDAQLAISGTYNVRATEENSTLPVYWCVFYTDRNFENPKELSGKMFAVIDSAGQLWFDPDGSFNDCRHYAYANPTDPNYMNDPDLTVGWDCVLSNKRCYVDPLPANNTQGPYFILPSKLDGSRQPAYKGDQPVYFRIDREMWEGFLPDPFNKKPPIETRLFQLGWCDVPDFPLIQDRSPSSDFPLIPSLGTTLKPRPVSYQPFERWDLRLSLVPFISDGDVNFEQGEEWHCENINADNRYTPAEWIYRRNSNAVALPVVAGGDMRLTDVVVINSVGQPRTYLAGSTVVDAPPLGMPDPGDDLDVGKPLVQFIYTGAPAPDAEMHTENVSVNGMYNPREFIYRKGDSAQEVASNDFALTDVNINRRRFTDGNGYGECELGGMMPGDMLLVAEILRCGPKAPTYDVMVESDIWAGNTPSTTTTSLYDPTGKPLKGAQNINKDTSLEPTAQKFSLPVSTFFNIHSNYRSYFGVSIFNDNGVDNSLDPGCDTYIENLSEDYKPVSQAEAYIGAKGDLDCADAYRTVPPPWGGEGLVKFSSLYKTTLDSSGQYGCNRTIYKKGSTQNNIVEVTDLRLFDLEVARSGNKMLYKAGSTVAQGDLDVGQNLMNLPGTLCFYDQKQGDNQPDGELQPNETIYNDLNANNIIDYGDVRMSPLKMGFYAYQCGDVVDEWNVWVHTYEVYGLTMGKCGFQGAIDMPMLPGKMELNVSTDKPLRVEQTSKIKIKTGINIQKGDKIYVTVRDLTSGTNIPFEQTGVISFDKPELNFEITPYRGSLFASGKYDPITVYAFAELAGSTDKQLPPCGNYVDLFYATKYMPVDNVQNPAQLWTAVPVPFPQPTIPLSIENTYDCYEAGYLRVYSEWLEIASTRKCLDQLEERFPNVSLECYDGDNPSDVNDTCCVPFSLGKEENSIVFFNATGSGVLWMATAVGSDGQKYIIQYQNDFTYYVWYWNDVGPIPGVLDAGDYIGDDPNFKPPTFIGSQKPIVIRAQAELVDNDLSAEIVKNSYEDDGFIPWGIVTKGDYLGIFNDEAVDPKTGAKFGKIEHFGVPTYITSRGFFNTTDVGGWAVAVVKPPQQGILKLRLSSNAIMLDYNSKRLHPAQFSLETHLGLDYSGYVQLKTLPIDGRVNFSEFQIIDHGLQYSFQNYTAGHMASFPLQFPAPQIQIPYNPILRNYQDDFRVYPGGQTHVGRIINMRQSMIRNLVHGWNSYPAIWSEWGQRYNTSGRGLGRDRDADERLRKVNFNKLGVEFAPLTDYGVYFVLKDGNGNHYTFNPGTITNPTPRGQMIKRLTLTGPFKKPKVLDPITGRVTNDFGFGGMIKLPIIYDYTGEVIVDNTNYHYYEFKGQDFTGITGYGDDKLVFSTFEQNIFLRWNHRMNYTGVDNVIVIDELTPIGSGKIEIEVVLFDGSTKKFQDCCSERNEDYIPVHGLTISGMPDIIPIGQDIHLNVKITEVLPMQVEAACNDAFVYIWQDRGIAFSIEGMDEPIHFGMGDGRTMGLPMPMRNTQRTGAAMFTERQDFNEDGKISFGDWETEIIGTYNFSTNTWYGGMVDARTFLVNNGDYSVNLTRENNCSITDYGMDIGGIRNNRMSRFITPADHCVSDNEVTPVYINAFKYGDDNNDRSFAPYLQLEWFDAAYTHEVYLAGEARVPIEPAEDLNVTVSPQPLTAGVVNELVDATQPLTIKVTDSSGVPVNLLEGVPDFVGDKTVEPEAAWINCFKDWHPDQQERYGFDARLPQYYWVRTDLHNKSSDFYNNMFFFSNWEDDKDIFQPISVDFTRARLGVYVFKGFVANDAGEFDLTIYSPDRKHSGKTKVRVASPKVEYQITNIEDPQQKMFVSPGEPDFVMTAADNRIYKITAVCRNAQGKLIKQPPPEARMCNSKLLYPAHFTPLINIPSNMKPRDWWPCNSCRTSYQIHIGLDYNEDGIIQRGNNELNTFVSFQTHREYEAWDAIRREPYILPLYSEVFYNTTNIHFSDNTFSTRPSVLLQPEYRWDITGWGLGCIYNKPYDGTFLFVDREKDGLLNYKDFLLLNELGSVTFYVFAEDTFNVGGLVACNPYTADKLYGDVAGAPMPYYTDPGFTFMRYRYSLEPGYLKGQEMGSRDGTFFLDWDALPETFAVINPPKFNFMSADSEMPLGTEIYNAANFDLVEGYDNSLLVEALPADDRDLPMKSGGSIIASGSNHSFKAQGSFVMLPGNKTPITYMTITPDGEGRGVLQFGFENKNTLLDKMPYELSLKDSPIKYSLYPVLEMDSAPGLGIQIVEPDPILTNTNNKVIIKVFNRSTKAIVENAKVRMISEEFDLEGTTDLKGTATIEVNPTQTGRVVIQASAAKQVSGELVVYIGKLSKPPMLDIDPYPQMTNQKTVTIKGKTSPGAKVTVGQNTAQVNPDGSFSLKLTLQEGVNTFTVFASLSDSTPTTETVSIVLDTVAPEFVVQKLPELIGAQQFELMGRIEPGCRLLVNGKEATVVYDLFKFAIDLVPGNNTLKIEAIDPVGNISKKDVIIPVFNKFSGYVVKAQKAVYNDKDEIVDQMQSEVSDDLWVPVDALRIMFGASYELNGTICTLKVFGSTYIMESGSTSALADNNPLTLSEAPRLYNGAIYISPQTLKDSLGIECSSDPVKGTVNFTKIWLP